MSHIAVVLFAHRRPQHLQRVLDSLAASGGSSDLPLRIYCDGPRSEAEQADCEAVRAVAQGARGFGALRVLARPRNLGLARSVVTGLDETFAEHSRVMVLEDDLCVHPGFLDYLRAALDRYSTVPRVGAIHAYTPDLPGLSAPYFLRGGDCWGWATWRDRWALYRSDTRALLAELHQRGLAGRFDSTGGSGMYLRLLKAHRGRWDSWAIRWHASLFLADRLCLHPGRSLVTNIGLDGSGTHGHQGATAAAPSPPPGTWDGHLPEGPPAEDERARKLLARHDRAGLAGLANAGQSWLQRQLHRRAFRP